MAKRIVSVFCALLFVLTLAPSVLAESTLPYGQEEIATPTLILDENAHDVVTNPGFEVLNDETTLQGWTATLGQLGVAHSDDAHTGEKAISLQYGSTISQVCGVSRLDSLKPCEISFWIKPTGEQVYLDMEVTFGIRNIYSQNETLVDKATLTVTDAPTGVWTQKVLKFMVPERTVSATMVFTSKSDGALLIDDVHYLIDGAPKKVLPPSKKEPVLKENFDMVRNGNFEDNNNYWQVEPGQWNDFVTIEKDEDGNSFARISKDTAQPTKNPQLLQKMYNIVEGAEYQVHFKLRSPGLQKVGSMSYGFRWMRGGERMGHDKTGNKVLYQDKEWTDVYLDSIAPEGADGLMFDFRNFGPEGFYDIDDVSIYMTKRPEYAEVETDEIFYYTEWPTGYITVRDQSGMNALEGGKAKAEIFDGETVIYTVEGFTGKEKLTMEFPTKILAEIGKEYKAKVTVTTKDGEITEVHEKPIYRYNRPTYLGADGVFRKPDRNGVMQETQVVLANGVNNSRIDIVSPAGIKIANLQGGADLPLNVRMDMAEAQGLKVMITLYSGKKCGGTEDMIPATIDKVMIAKDHPALFGYKVQDEPMQKGNTDEELIRAYTTIRNLDPHHPVYLVDSGEASYERMGKFCDIMDIDWYPSKGLERATIIGEKIAYGVEAVKGRKPVTLLQQAFELNNTFPTVDEFRHYAYQTFFNAGSGFGYHSFGEATTSLSPNHEVWPGLCEMAKWEQDFMFETFVQHKYPILNEEKTDKTWWRSYVIDGKIYVAVINQTLDTVNVNINLAGFDGGYGAASYTAKLVAGGEDAFAITGTTFTKELPCQAAYVYEITPDAPVDFTGLNCTKYRDLVGYGWAHTAITNMEQKGIVNDLTAYLYGPAKKISRGDFAYFLINALGLTSDSTETFADVSPDSHYAKAIATGKALGILMGIGENLYNPNAEITRQDLMTIAGRGMRYVKDLANADSSILGTFSDASLIADYAVENVSAMVNAGIVKGNADGTINPLSNTTRAEAAVIADRIYSWNK